MPCVQVNTNGAGDSMVGAMAAAMARGCAFDDATTLARGLGAAALSCVSHHAVSHDLDWHSAR